MVDKPILTDVKYWPLPACSVQGVFNRNRRAIIFFLFILIIHFHQYRTPLTHFIFLLLFHRLSWLLLQIFLNCAFWAVEEGVLLIFANFIFAVQLKSGNIVFDEVVFKQLVNAPKFLVIIQQLPIIIQFHFTSCLWFLTCYYDFTVFYCLVLDYWCGWVASEWWGLISQRPCLSLFEWLLAGLLIFSDSSGGRIVSRRGDSHGA